MYAGGTQALLLCLRSVVPQFEDQFKDEVAVRQGLEQDATALQAQVESLQSQLKALEQTKSGLNDQLKSSEAVRLRMEALLQVVWGVGPGMLMKTPGGRVLPGTEAL